MGFTVEQQAVIDARNSNILVSAAAGSGKTTVLVERIIQRITGEKGIDIDRLLVVTFTKAAASQMKEKILVAIQKKLLEEPNNQHLQRQETLVHGAQIMTIDAFCQYVIRNNFNEIGLDPSYRVGDEGEMKLLRADVLEELLEEKYGEGSEDFYNCTEYFSTGNNDKKLESFILQLYDYAMSMPFPEEWLAERTKDYFISEDEFNDSFFVKRCMKNAYEVINECIARESLALSISNEPDGPYQYADLLTNEIERFEELAQKENLSFDEFRALLLNISFDRLPGKKDPSVNLDKREAAKKHRTYAKDRVDKLCKEYFAEDKATIIAHMKLAEKPVETLADLAISFKAKFDEAKRERGIIDFGDMEHLALQILVKKDENGVPQPTNAAAQFREFYEEVMIDEYQDSNNVQELLLSAVSGEPIGKYNRFMVGDVKQSIYKFRLARPEIFMEKMKNYDSRDEAPMRKISLHNNFRSRREVLDGTNYIFEQIMGEDLGGVLYDKDAALRTGASYPEPLEKREFAPEILLVNADKCKADAGRELEARMTANRIESLMKDGHVTDDNGELRAVRYSDIVILLRAASGWDDIYKRVFEEKGIPAYVESRTGYFSATEVVTLLNVLNILNNPMQDIPLVSVMHSPIGGFTDEELACIKASDKGVEKTVLDGGSFFEILKRCAERGENKELSDKINNFLAFLSEKREKAIYLPVDELLSDILETTNYYEYCAALPGGERRVANLNMLIEKAVDYERTSFKGLFHFVRYIEQLAKYEVDFGEAGVLDEHADVVRIMSIHKSKGLEFPIVFIAGMAKEFNYMDTNQAVVCDMDLGIGTHAIDLERRIKYRTLRKEVMDDCMKMDVLGEEMRILYVAMTRAKEKLIMTGQVKVSVEEKIPAGDFRNKLDDYLRLRGRQKTDGSQPYLLPYFKRSSASSYLELVLMALARHSDMESLCQQLGVDVETTDEDSDLTAILEDDALPVSYDFNYVTPEDLTGEELKSDIGGNLKLAVLDSPQELDADDKIKIFEKRFAEKYPYEAYSRLYVKTTVSELKKAALEEEHEPSNMLIQSDSSFVPSFIEKEDKELAGAARGTVYHRVMELIYDDPDTEFEKRKEDIPAFIKDLESDGKLSEGALCNVNVKDINAFLQSEIGQRMERAMYANALHRESQFMMGVPARRLDDSLPEGELVLVQGIIDVWFEEGDDLILLDYKTDKVRKGQELVDKYKTQLDYYQEALEKITHKKVKERLIYSFTLGELINI